MLTAKELVAMGAAVSTAYNTYMNELRAYKDVHYPDLHIPQVVAILLEENSQ